VQPGHALVLHQLRVRRQLLTLPQPGPADRIPQMIRDLLIPHQPDRKLKERIMLALATLTTQGRALGYCVVAALQDPRKFVPTIRNLFPDRIAMRLDEPEQTWCSATAPGTEAPPVS
jgi:hypothetical protein